MTEEEKLYNINILDQKNLPTPQSIRETVAQSPASFQTVAQGRKTIQEILDRKDRRILMVVGPCAIHDVEAGLEYARKLKALAAELRDQLFVVMRVYFEKPRTTTGWKGLINDPFLNDTFRIDDGLVIARKLLFALNEVGVPVATEALDPVVPQYLGDFVSWTAIGARTAESQTHREMASGLSTPVGFKNGTDGGMQVAVNAVKAASVSHRFLGINQLGQSCVFHTAGNRYTHVVLRGGLKPNYDRESVERCEEVLNLAGLPANIMVDCSHGNSNKDPSRQPLVLDDCLKQIEQGNKSLIGFMIESNLEAGRQDLKGNASELRYGVSITDACIGWDTTEEVLRDAAKRLLSREIDKA